MPPDPDPSLAAKRLAPKASIENWLDEYAVREPAGGLMDDIAEVAWLSDTFDTATARLWHEHVKAGSTKESANRTWQRLRKALVDHGVPHELVAAGKMTGVRITVSRQRLEAFSLPLKRCMRKACAAHEKAIPARPPFFYRNKANADGLDAICSTCRRAKPQASKTSEAQRAAHRRYNQSAAGQARSTKFKANSYSDENKLKNDINVPLETLYGHAPMGVTTPPCTEVNAQDSDTMNVSLSPQEQKSGMPVMPDSTCMSVSQLSKHLSAALDRDVPDYTIAYLLKQCPELEPPKIHGKRTFYSANVAALQAIFAAGWTAKDVKAAKAAARTAPG